jgi:hypothetical protein
VGGCFAIVSYWISDFLINAAQLPCRILATDLVELDLQPVVMARFSVCDNAGKLLAFSLGSISLTSDKMRAPSDTELVTDIRCQFLIACFWIVFSFMITVSFAKEKDTRSYQGKPWGGFCVELTSARGVVRDNVVETLYSEGRDPLVPLKHCAQIEGLAWAAWSTVSSTKETRLLWPHILANCAALHTLHDPHHLYSWYSHPDQTFR